jgi:hypothetical protein
MVVPLARFEQNQGWEPGRIALVPVPVQGENHRQKKDRDPLIPGSELRQGEVLSGQSAVVPSWNRQQPGEEILVADQRWDSPVVALSRCLPVLAVQLHRWCQVPVRDLQEAAMWLVARLPESIQEAARSEWKPPWPE